MADTEALHDAERLLAQADALLAAIDREIAAMEAALATAQEGIARAEATGRETGRHVDRLGRELAAGHQLQRAMTECDAAVAERGRRLRERTLSELAAPPALVAGSSRPSPGTRAAAALPVWRAARRSRIAAIEPRPLQTDREAWDLLAADHPALGEEIEKAYAILDQAQALADASIAEGERLRRQRAAEPKTRQKGAETP